jgi:hypothetical protein
VEELKTERWRMTLVGELLREQGYLIIGCSRKHRIGAILPRIRFFDVPQYVSQPFQVINAATPEENIKQRTLALKLRPGTTIYNFPEHFHLYKVRTD